MNAVTSALASLFILDINTLLLITISTKLMAIPVQLKWFDYVTMKSYSNVFLFWWRLYNYRELKRDSCSWEIVSTLVFSGYVTHFKLVSGNWNKRLLIFHLSAIIWIQKMNMISHKRQLFINPLILIACTYTFANSSARLSQCCCVCPWHWQMRESYEAKCPPPPFLLIFIHSFPHLVYILAHNSLLL